MLKSKILIVLFICAVLMFSIYSISCSSNKVSVASIETEYTEDGKIKINFWTALDSQPTKNIIETFNNSQDKYYVELIFKGSYAQTLDAGIEALKLEQQPHLLLVADSDTSSMTVLENAYKPANEILSKNALSSYKFIANIESQYSKNGKLQSFPFNHSTPVLIYNKDMLRAAGIDINNIDNMQLTFETMYTILYELKNMGYVPMTGSESSMVFLETLSSIENVSFATHNNGLANSKKARIKFSELHKRTFEYLENLNSRGLYRYYGRGNGGQSQFVQGNVAMILAPSHVINEVKEAGYFDYGVTYMPYFAEFIDEPKNSILGGASIWAFEGFSKDVYLAIAQFVDFIYSDDVMFYFYKNTGYLPPTIGAYNYAVKQGYYQSYPEEQVPYFQLMRAQGDNSKGYNLGNFTKMRVAYEEALEMLFRSQGIAEDAVLYFETRANHLLEDFEKAN